MASRISLLEMGILIIAGYAISCATSTSRAETSGCVLGVPAFNRPETRIIGVSLLHLRLPAVTAFSGCRATSTSRAGTNSVGVSAFNRSKPASSVSASTTFLAATAFSDS